jgi:predicted ATP-grasp superfamily ATP-dependent carboligase
LRPAVVFGQLHAGLALTRALGRDGVPVHGIAQDEREFGLRSRYLLSKRLARSDEDVLELLRSLQERPVLFPERDENVAFVLRNWHAVRELADVPLPADPEIVLRLRRKERLPVEAAAADVAAPATVLARDEEAIRAAALQPPLLVKPAEGQEFALAFGEKAVVALDPDAAVAAWRRAHEHGFDTIVQELIPDSHDFVFSLLTYIGREGEPLASVTGRKVRQGPLRFGTSAVFEARREPEVEEQGLRLLRHVGYRGFAHVELVRDPRDATLKLVEVNTRLPIWAGIAMGAGRDFNLARIAYDDLTGRPARSNGAPPDGVSWIYMAKDVWVSAQMARRRELRPGQFLSHYVRRNKVRSVFAADDPLPALASVAYLRSRL